MRPVQLFNELYEIEIKSIYKFCLILQLGFISFYLYLKKELVPKRIDFFKWIYDNKSMLFNIQ